jgi:hypothetical protein
MSEHPPLDPVVELRLTILERSTATLANAATEQVAFNSAVRTWGKVGLLLYGLGQGVLIGVILYGIEKAGS